MGIIEWTENRKPNKQCPYDHCIGETPFGNFLLTWKGHKDEPDFDASLMFDETPWNDVWVDLWGGIEGAKRAAEERYLELIREEASRLEKYL